MHFSNHRKSSIMNKKQSKPCPYHSRISSSITNESLKRSRHSSIVYAEYAENNRKASMNQDKKIHHKSANDKLPKIAKSRIVKTETIEPLIDP